MRLRLGGILLFALTVSGVTSACSTAGISTVYMAIDGAGQQRRTEFYTDSLAIYCIAKFSSARQDATLDFEIRQLAVFDWSDNKIDTTNVHPVFARGEQTPGVGTETVVAEELPPQGVQDVIPCNGIQVPNLPTGGTTCATADTGQKAGQCPPPPYASLGYDSAGPGYTCCELTVTNGQSMTTTPPANIPYPTGNYECDVYLDGVFQQATEFSIIFPPAPAASSSDSLFNPAPTTGSVQSCPVEPPITGIPCYNWVPCGAQCEGFYPDQTCSCEPDGVWNCGGT